MKYSEFREYLKGTIFEVNEDNAKVQVNIDGIECIKISKTKTARPEEFQLLKKAIELAETPLDEREEEKKYYLKFTKAEIEELKAKFNTDLTDFEMIEVED